MRRGNDAAIWSMSISCDICATVALPLIVGRDYKVLIKNLSIDLPRSKTRRFRAAQNTDGMQNGVYISLRLKYASFKSELIRGHRGWEPWSRGPGRRRRRARSGRRKTLRRRRLHRLHLSP